MKQLVLWLLCAALILPFASCYESELPPDAEDPAEALTRYVRAFWDSEMYENAIFDAFYNSKTASEELKSFNRLNAMNAKYKILTMSGFDAQTLSIAGTTATVSLSIHGINFGEYAEAYLAAFDMLQASVIIVEGRMIGLTNEEVTIALRFMPIDAASNEKVTFRDFEQTFEMKYRRGEWVISKPAYKDGKVFLELFAEHITEILDGKYKFRQGK